MLRTEYRVQWVGHRGVIDVKQKSGPNSQSSSDKSYDRESLVHFIFIPLSLFQTDQIFIECSRRETKKQRKSASTAPRAATTRILWAQLHVFGFAMIN